MEKLVVEVKLPRLNDMHAHLRQGEMMEAVVPYTAAQCSHAVVMPNLNPPILTGLDARNYEGKIRRIADKHGHGHFTPLMTIYINGDTTPKIAQDAVRMGVVAGKIYPIGVTTGSEKGVSDFRTSRMQQVFKSMEEEGMILSLHGEMPAPVFTLDREEKFLSTLEWIATQFPDLKIVLEHITTAAAVRTVKKLGPNVAATITAHHLAITLDDVIGGMLRPHNFCKPVAKRPEDREALWNAIDGALDPKFFIGSDTAPHLRGNKECSSGCAGVFTAPILIQLLASMYDKRYEMDFDWMERITQVGIRFGAKFYGLPVDEKQTVTLVKKPFTIPDECHGVVPFMAGETLPYSIAE